jgi:hypothetical protein
MNLIIGGMQGWLGVTVQRRGALITYSPLAAINANDEVSIEPLTA